MIKIKSSLLLNIITFGQAKAMSLFVFLIYKDSLSEVRERHETIHYKQGIELGFVLFWILYLWFSLFRGYWRNPFEMEAFQNQSDDQYLKNRKSYSWVKYL